MTKCGCIELEERSVDDGVQWREDSYCHYVILLHEARFVTSEQAEHAQDEGYNGTSHREES